MEEKLFILNRFGEKLEALVRYPNKDGRFPAVIFVSGFGMELHEYINSNDEISKRLIEKGFITLQFSFAGCGRSDGDYREMTLERQGKQIEDIIAHLHNRPDVIKGRIGIHATSFGVPSTMCAVVADIKTFCFVGGAYYPGKSLRQVFIEERNVKIEDGKDVVLPRSNGEMTIVGKHFFSNIDAFMPENYAGKITQPAFVIHGDKDTKLETKEVLKAFSYFPGKSKKLKIFRYGDHGITDVPRPMREEFLRDVVEWFEETL